MKMDGNRTRNPGNLIQVVPAARRQNQNQNQRTPVTPVSSYRSPSGHSPVAEALRLTPKGQQRYDPYWHDEGRIKEVLEECTKSPPITLRVGLDFATLSISSPRSGTPQSNQTSLSQLNLSTPTRHNDSASRTSQYSESVSHIKSTTGDQNNDSNQETTITSPKRIKSPALSPTLRPSDIELKLFNQQYERKKQVFIDKILEEKETEWRQIHERAEAEATQHRLRQEYAARIEAQKQEQLDRALKAEIEKAQARQIEEKQRYRKQLDAKFRAAEARKQDLLRQEQERELQREQEKTRQVEELTKYATDLVSARDQAVKSVTEFPYKDKLPEMTNKGLELLKMIATQAVTLLEKARVETPGPEYVTKFRALIENANNAQTCLRTAFDCARKAGEEEAAQKEEEKKAQEAAQAAQTPKPAPDAPPDQAAGDDVLCVAVDAFREYSQRMDLLLKVQEEAKPLSETQDRDTKKYKNEVMKAVTTPVNAISSRSGDDLRDKLKRLQNVLKGETVEVGGKRVSIRNNRAALPFVKHVLALKLANQGDEPVSSKHEAAFPIAAIVLGVWCTLPEIGELVLANLHKLCPYTVPYYIPQTEGQSVEDHNKCLGYKYRDGKPEQQDKFLSRMSGYMRLYAAIIVTDLPPGANSTHPHGLGHAWRWLCRVVNLPPHPDITATLLYDMLQVTGHYLDKAFTKQFHKLLNLILTVFLPKIREVTADGRLGPVTRLELCLETWLREKRISAPEGIVTSNFWFTRDDSADLYYY